MKLSNSSINKIKNPCIIQYWFCLVFLLCFVVFGQYPLNNNFVVKEWLIERWSDSSWNNYQKLTYNYDLKWNLTERLGQNWNSEWVDLDKCIYSYNQDNNLIEFIFQNWSTSENIWKLKQKTIYSYNSQKQLIEEINYMWESIDSSWHNNLKYDYTYDTVGRLEECKNYEWFIDWELSTKIVYSYNSNNKVIEELKQYFDEDSMWINFSKFKYTYDLKSNLVEWLHELWSEDKWENRSLKKYTYDSLNNQIEEIVQSWSNITNEWYNSSKYYSNYDSYNNKIETIWYEWTEINGQWQWYNYYRYQYSYYQIVNIKEYSFKKNYTITLRVLPNGIYFHTPQKNSKNLILSIYNLLVSTDFSLKIY